jgi:hypothetical protein
MNLTGDRPAGRAAILSRALIPLAAVGLILFFFNKMAFTNLILARGDTFLYFYPYWTAAAEALRAGRVPLWNPDIFMGAPFLANSQAGFFYPLNWPLWWLLPAPYAVNASTLIHLMIALAGTYFAGRQTLALERPAALFAAALFALGGYLTAQVEHVNQLQGLVWLPWYFVALSPLVSLEVKTRTWREIAPIVLAVGALFALQLLAGHTQTAFISGVAVALWLVFHAARREERARFLLFAAAVVAAGAILAGLLAAAQLLPTLELTGQSSRQGGLPLNEVLSFSWHPLHLTRASLPGYGQPLFSEYVVFLPLTGLALAVVGGWVWRRNPAVLPWVGLTASGFILALGRFTPVYYFLGQLPGFDLFRAPARWLVVAALALALLAGFGWQRLYRFATTEWAAGERERVRRDLTRPLITAGIGLTALILWGYVAGLLARFVPVGAEAPFERPIPLALLGWLIEFALAGLLLWIILTAPADRARRATFDLIVLALAALWLGSRGLPYNQLTTPEAYFDLRPSAARLQALAGCAVPGEICPTPSDRFLSLSGIFFDPGDTAEIESIYADQLDPEAGYDYVVAIKNKEVLSPNLSMIAGLPAVDGFDGGVLPLRAYSQLMALILPESVATSDGRLREYLTATPDSRWLSLFNSRYLITDKTGDVWREEVFFDRQHPVQIAGEAARVADVPALEATELMLIAEGVPPPVEIVTSAGDVWRLDAELLAAPDLYRVVFPEPAVAELITLLPCSGEVDACGVAALTLVDERDDTFQSLVVAPYRLIFSGDVKIYENLEVQPRAFMVYDWQWAGDTAAAVAAMRADGFDPRQTAVVVGQGEPPPDSGSGAVEVVSYTPERVVLRADSDTPGLLVLTDAYYPGWEATVNGAAAEIRQVNGLFRGVFLPAGQHEVEFRFRPDSFRRGAVVSLVGLGLLFVVAILITIGTRRPPLKA